MKDNCPLYVLLFRDFATVFTVRHLWNLVALNTGLPTVTYATVFILLSLRLLNKSREELKNATFTWEDVIFDIYFYIVTIGYCTAYQYFGNW